MPNIGVAVCSRPNFEAATNSGCLALQHAVDAWLSRGYAIIDLKGENAVRAKVLAAFASTEPIFFFGVGHGNEDIYTGQNYDKIFWTCDSSALKDRIVFALSCITAVRLGPDAVSNKGCRTYIGYAKEFGWIQGNLSLDPFMDSYARGFYEAALEIVYKLTDGANAGDAYKASVDKWNYWIDVWSKSEDPNAALVLQWLISDRDYQKLIGDVSATVTVGIPSIPSLWWMVQTLGAAMPMVIPAIVIGGAEVDKLGLWG